ncbi:MAG TPA: alpha-amylase/4-alpha-glucanotransferase domain-containing protein [Spirochaetia bacterium]|nr:alpha-amylase/4-alpha-glucanotransferase domain-containing protein [Spirochaetia bacterium]
MNKVRLIFGTTNTQPVGTPDDEVEAVYQNAYKPFLRELYNFPEIPITMHYSGTLLTWLQERHSEFIDVLAEMAGRRQIELLGGAFYDPVLPLIPRADALGQIESLTTLIRKLFGRRPRGSWITEQVWEPTMASTLKNSGVEYIFLDDYHFITGGLSESELNQPVITEDQGKTIIVFPNSYDMRGRMCVDSPERVIEFLRSHLDDGDDRLVCAIYDGERYGAWAESHKLCYDQKWINRFLTLIKENLDWIEPINPWRYLRRPIPRMRAYFPSTSYEEMMVWTLAPKKQKDFEGIRKKVTDGNGRNSYVFGGFFRHFLTRYPESNLMYSKMQYTHILVNQLRGDKYRKLAAREELWKGQCHNAYWHGRPGGIYRNNLRKHVYSSLIEAEKVTREKGIFIPSIITVDFDMDGLTEYLYQGQDMNAYVHVVGGTLFELDYLPSPWNYLDTLARHPEGYHTAEIARRGYDSYARKSFIDHFFDQGVTIDEFDRCAFEERGSFVSSPYEVTSYNRDHHTLALRAPGIVKVGRQQVAVEIHKSFKFRDTTVVVECTVSNISDSPCSLIYGIELNFAFESARVEHLRTYHKPDRGKLTEIGPHKQELQGTSAITYEDLINNVSIQLNLARPTGAWSLPVETLSRTSAGFETFYQSSCVVVRYPIELDPGAEWRTELSVQLGKL